MSLARLSALVSRAAAPPGRLAREATTPAFDAPAAVGTAMLEAGLAAATSAAQARRAAAAAPHSSPRAQAEPAVAVELTARPAAPPALPRHAAAPEAAQGATAPMPPRIGPATIAPAAHREAVSPTADTPRDVTTAAPSLPSASPALPIAAKPMSDAPAAHAVAQRTNEPAREERAGPPLPPARALTTAEPMVATRTQPAAPPPAEPTPAPPAAAPAITIGTVEVVIAQPTRKPAAAPAPRPAPDRGFSRYAAIRSGRDRAW